MIRIEIEFRAVSGPGDVGIIIASAGELFRRDLVVTAARRVDDPDVLRVLRIEIAGAVGAIHRARDHAYVALARLFLLRFSWARRRRGRWLLRRGLLRQIFRVSAAYECDHLAVG